MRSAAKVGEIPVRVERYGSVGKFTDEFTFVLVTLCRECLHCLSLGNFPAYELLVSAGEFNHLVLNCLKVGFGNLLSSEIHIIVETILYCRPDSEFHSGIKGLKSLRHKVGT